MWQFLASLENLEAEPEAFCVWKQGDLEQTQIMSMILE